MGRAVFPPCCLTWDKSISSVQLLSCAQLFVTPMDCSTQNFPIHHQLSELAQTHVYQVGDASQPSHPLSSPSPAFSLVGADKYSSIPLIWGTAAATAAAKSLQLCPTLCNPIDGSPPGSPIPGILQARTLEWVAISFFNAWKQKVKVKSLFTTPWTAAFQAPLPMGFSRQEYWSGVPLPSPHNFYSRYHRNKNPIGIW